MITTADKHMGDSSTKAASLMLMLTAVVFWFFLPVLSIFLLCYLHIKLSNYKVFALFLMALTFGLIASTTKPITSELTDIARYKSTYLKLATINSFQEFIVATIVLSGEVNILFTIVNYVFSLFLPTYHQIVPLFWVTLTYFFTFLTFYEYSKHHQYGPTEYALFFVLIGILGIPFYQTTETIKQCSAFALFSYALVLKVYGRPKSLLYLIIALLTHVSTIMILPTYLFCKQKWIVKWILPLFLIVLVLSFFNLNEMINNYLGDFLGGGFKERAELYTEYGWELSRRYNIILYLFGAMVLFAFWYFQKAEQQSESDSYLLNIHLLSFLILFLNRNNVHNFVRYILTYYPFYNLLLLHMINFQLPKRQKIIIWFVLSAFFAYSNYLLLVLRTNPEIGYANSYLDNSISLLLSSNVLDIINFEQ